MTRPSDGAKIIGLRLLNQTIAANDLAEAKVAENKANDRRLALESQADENLAAWSEYLGSRAVDPDHLQRLSIMINDDARSIAIATDELDKAARESEERSLQLATAGINLKQAEALNKKLTRDASRNADERSAQALEERLSFGWGHKR